MPTLRGLLVRIVGALHRTRAELELNEELETHRAMLFNENLRRGLAQEEALRQANIALGNTLSITEGVREQAGLPGLESLWQDVRFGVRQLRRAPGFTATAVLTLALGVGANTAIFSAVHALLLRALPFPNSQNLIALWCRQPSRGIPRLPLSIPDYFDAQQQLRSFEGIAAYWGVEDTITGIGEPTRVQGITAFASYFQVLSVTPILGRTFTADEQQWGRHHVVVISRSLWISAFAADPAVVGRTIQLDAEPFTIIGVMPDAASVLNPRIQVWIPASAPPDHPPGRNNRWMHVIARLRPGISLEFASAEFETFMRTLGNSYDEDKGITTYIVPLQHEITDERTRSSLILLLVMVGLLLLIASANIANLLLARGTTRTHEIAIRTSLGANRTRLIRQLLTEHMLLAFCGGSAGVAFAIGGVALLRRMSVHPVPRAATMALDVPVLVFAVGITAVSGVLCGILPALASSRAQLHEDLSTRTRKASLSRARSALVAIETAFAVALLIGAGLLLHSLYRLETVNVGFSADDVVVAEFDLPRAHYPENVPRLAFVRDLSARASQLPKVRAVGETETVPLYPGNQFWTGFVRQEQPVASWEHVPTVAHVHITPGYFAAMRIPLMAGRDFSEQDTPASDHVAIVSEALRRRFFAGEEAIGRRIKLGVGEGDWLTVVGVVGDVAYELDKEQPPIVYTAFVQGVNGVPSDMLLVVRTDSDPHLLFSQLRDQIHQIDHDLVFRELTTMSEVLSQAADQPRVTVTLLSVFAGLALLMAAVGIYGVLAYTVTQRTHEIGIRMALGALPSHVLAMVVSKGLRTAMWGVAAGLVLGSVTARLLRTLLFEVRPLDPATYAMTVGVFLAVTVFASYLPARRAARVAPSVALRHE